MKRGKRARKRTKEECEKKKEGPTRKEIEPSPALQNLLETMYCVLESPEAKQFQECLAKPFWEG